MTTSQFENIRFQYIPKVPKILKQNIRSIICEEGEKTTAQNDIDNIKAILPNIFGKPTIRFKESNNTAEHQILNIGVILSGGQAPGGHNVISGLFDAIKEGNTKSQLFGFMNGPDGLLTGNMIKITNELLSNYRNTGGFDIIGSGRTKIETPEQFAQVLKTCQSHKLNALVIIGGDDSNTNAALLAEYFVQNNSNITVVGCPKTIDGDLKNDYIEVSFGFDTATKVYSELIANLQKDAQSAKKHWHFIRLMGRSASHIALECSLLTNPDVTLISEEIRENKITLEKIIEEITNVIVIRSKAGKDYGIVLIPEGLIEFLPGLDKMISELNDLLANDHTINSLTVEMKIEKIISSLSQEPSKLFSTIPFTIQKQLLGDRDPHGNVQVSHIETEKLLIELIEKKLKNEYPEVKLKTLTHFFGYEGRCSFPSNFDADYCYSLGRSAYLLINYGKTGYISSVSNLEKSTDEWSAGGLPITMMMNIERRHGSDKAVIKKALVDLEGEPFQYFKNKRYKDIEKDSYKFPGPIQFFGPSEITDSKPISLLLEKGKEI